MAERNQKFDFDLSQRVIVKEIQRPGKIDALVIDYLGVQYRVSYWDNGKRESVYLFADELESR